MSRPTLGREASPPTSARTDQFPRVLASALDRTAQGAPALPPPALAAVPEWIEEHPRPPEGAPAGHGPGGGGTPLAGFGVPVAGGPAAGDTPGAAQDHPFETVEPDSRPLWREFLAHRDPSARRRLVEYHASLVRGVGTKLATRLPSSIELADLLQVGTFGLMEAVDRFDPARGVRFEGYAAQRIRGAMLDELRAQDWVPRTVRARVREIERAREAVRSRGAGQPSDRELAAELGIRVRELRQASRPMHLVSAESLADGGTGGIATLAADDGVDPVVVALRAETGAELRTAISLLGERDRLVLQLYYLEDHTLAEIGALLGVTESRVCQLHSRMLTRLRGRLEAPLAG
ncbi:FliA/WhiG family RNA polymerase sigma factor [Pseudonocardia nematodicida]|uniref:RNA polymerase sigma factor n=1 Tax=Pseudonocardia nematodicida TaxID=1206997 RepID=A0ABV1KK78_9PSEU